MDYNWLSVLILLSTLIYCGHFQDLPRASVKLLTPQKPLYTGDTVTLQCYIPEYTDWTYRWYRDNQEVYNQTRETISFSLPDQAGLYKCQGMKTGRPHSSYISDNLPISVSDLPRASVSISPQGHLYSGETVTLQCDIPDYTDWRYHWYENNQKRPNLTSKSISYTTPITKAGQTDQYSCEGSRTGRPQTSQSSNTLSFSINDNRPKATLSSDQQDVFTEDSVTLTCTVESSGWTFYWYKHSQDSKPVATTSETSYTLSQVRVSDGGKYWCRAGRGKPVYYTQYSQPGHINVTEKPVAVLTLQHNWTQIFSGESVTMICNIHGGGDTDWMYKWYKDDQSVYSESKPEYKISSVHRSDSGSYTCMGLKGKKSSETSDAVQLTMSNKPKAVLSSSPQWLNPGDSVTLSCEVKEMSTGWRFFWYKTVPYRAELPSLLDQSYSVEPLSGNGTTEGSYSLSLTGPTHTGRYVCRAGRGEPVYYTHYSEPQFTWTGDLQSSVSLRINPNRTQHFSSQSLSLSCDLKGNSTGWRLMRYTETGVKSGCSSNRRSITGFTCTITSTHTRDSGVYWCESGSGVFSNAVNITISNDNVILESPVHPVTEGDSVTLNCTYKYESSFIAKVEFYKDGVLIIRNETRGKMTIPTISKSDTGFYKCKSNKGTSPGSWVTVRDHGSSTSVLVGVVVRLVVAAVLLVILFVLLCRYKNGKCSCSNRVFLSIHPQSTNQDPQQNQGSTHVQTPDAGYTSQQYEDPNLYHRINHSDNDHDIAGDSEASGLGDVMYSEIQLKTLDYKKKDKEANPKESQVYAEVKTGKATVSTHLTS